MTVQVVLDASALIALYRGEPGAEAVAGLRESAALSAVNLVEVAETALAHSFSGGRREAEIERLGIAVVPFTAVQAERAAEIKPATRKAGLSLADRACLALALELGVPALTADRAWRKVNVGVDVRLIR